MEAGRPTTTEGGDTGKPHDPATYITFAEQFADLRRQIDPSISIGLDVGSPGRYNNWTADILQQSAAQGFMPGFLSDHNYVQAPGSESDSNLLLDTVSDPSSDPSDPGNPYDWAVRAADYESLITQYLGSAGENVQLLATEFNSVYTDPGKQTTSLVNGLFVADSLGALLETPYDGADVWDLRDGCATGGNDSSSLYGWRQGGDYGLLGSPGGIGTGDGGLCPLPDLLRRAARVEDHPARRQRRAGRQQRPESDRLRRRSSRRTPRPAGHQQERRRRLTGQFQFTDFTPPILAQVWQYGEAQDTAQSQTTDGSSSLATFTHSRRERLVVQRFLPGLLDDGPGPGQGGLDRLGTDDHAARRRLAEPRDRGDDSVIGHRNRPVGHLGPDLHLVDDRDDDRTRHLQRQRQQRRPECHRHLLGRRVIHLPGHGERPERRNGDQQRDG